MNTKVAFSIFAVIVVLVLAFFLLHPTQVPAPTSTVNYNQIASTSSTSATPVTPAAHTQPAISVGTPMIKVTPVSALLDSNSFVSTSKYPMVTGTANVSQIGVIINNSKNIGIVATSEVPVVNSRWSYSCSVALKPGTYTVIVFVGKTVTATAKLTVQ